MAIPSYLYSAVSPQSGSLIKSDATLFPAADLTITSNIISGNASILSIRLNNLAGNNVPHYFVIDIPAGKHLYLNERILTLSQGMYNIDAIAVDSLSLTGATDGITAPLDKVDGTPCQTNLCHTTNTPVNPIIREYGYVDTGSAQGGQARVAGTTGSQAVLKRLSGLSILRITKLNEGSFTANLVYSAWELDA